MFIFMLLGCGIYAQSLHKIDVTSSPWNGSSQGFTMTLDKFPDDAAEAKGIISIISDTEGITHLNIEKHVTGIPLKIEFALTSVEVKKRESSIRELFCKLNSKTLIFNAILIENCQSISL